MGRRRGGRRGRHSFKIPVLTLAILAGQALLANAGASDLGSKLNHFQRFYTGFNLQATGLGYGGFEPSYLAIGYGPWLVKGLVTKIARPMGAMPRVPFGLPISIT